MNSVNLSDYPELVYRAEFAELIINYWGQPPLSVVSMDPWADWRPPTGQVVDADQFTESCAVWDQPGVDDTAE